MKTYEFGVTLKDKITGFKGIVTGYASYITGCDQYLIIHKVNKEGKAGDHKWFDENRLELLKSKQIKITTGSGINDNGACEEAPTK